MTNEQAKLTPTVSALSLGGLIKHLGMVESNWIDFIEQGAAVMPEEYQDLDWENLPPEAAEAFGNGFRLVDDETLAAALAEYQHVADRTAQVIGTVDLDLTQELPPAPWFEQGAAWSARRVVLHLISETSQHSGHADIIREAIDGQKTMG